jgi:hypothetical protein
MSILNFPDSFGGFSVKAEASLFWRLQRSPEPYSVIYAVPEIVPMEFLGDMELAAIVNACPGQGDEFFGSEIPWLTDGKPVKVTIENSIVALKILKKRKHSGKNACLEVKCALNRLIKGFAYL